MSNDNRKERRQIPRRRRRHKKDGGGVSLHDTHYDSVAATPDDARATACGAEGLGERVEESLGSAGSRTVMRYTYRTA